MESFERFKEKISDEKCFYRSVKDGATGDNGKKIKRSHKRLGLFDVHQNLK